MIVLTRHRGRRGRPDTARLEEAARGRAAIGVRGQLLPRRRQELLRLLELLRNGRRALLRELLVHTRLIQLALEAAHLQVALVLGALRGNQLQTLREKGRLQLLALGARALGRLLGGVGRLRGRLRRVRGGGRARLRLAPRLLLLLARAPLLVELDLRRLVLLALGLQLLSEVPAVLIVVVGAAHLGRNLRRRGRDHSRRARRRAAQRFRRRIHGVRRLVKVEPLLR